MVRFTGNFNRIGNLGERLERLATAGYQDATHRAAVAVDLVIEKQFTRGRGPGGNTWKPLADKKTRSYLQDSGAMKRATKAVRGVGGIVVSAPRPAGWHQSGTKNKEGGQKMPARPIVPRGSELPPSWLKPIQAACREVFLEVGKLK